MDIAAVITSGFAGWQITVDDGRVAAALVDRGEVLVRHAHLMTLDLADADRASSVAVASCSIGPLEMSPDRYAHLMTSAYPVGHVDHDPAELLPGGARHTIATYLSGEVVGSVRWDASCEARDGDDVIGFIVVSMAERGRVFPGGPWVTDVAVDPRFHGGGVGSALLVHAIDALVRAGDDQIGLAVSHGNRARDLYRRLGFVEFFESWRFMIAGS
ncbi:MAG: GNAT family N-acetyltransferase [Acidimicrobiia bacterium]